ncbi:MAG TPA: hypothetical protein VGD68_11620 [Streptosporangiaceae bacterium]
MEPGNTKHGPLRDDELAREPDPVDDPRELFEGEAAATTGAQAVELRSELARLLTRDEFPLSRSGLLTALDGRDASAALVERASGLPGQSRYHSTRELIEALGLAHAEEDPGH